MWEISVNQHECMKSKNKLWIPTKGIARYTYYIYICMKTKVCVSIASIYFLLYVETDPWNSEWALGPAKSVNKLSSKLEKGASKWCAKLNYKSVWYQPTNTTLDSCFVLICKDSSAVLSTNYDFTLVLWSNFGIKCNCKILNLDGSNYLFENRVSSDGKLANQLLKPNREKENTK